MPSTGPSGPPAAPESSLNGSCLASELLGLRLDEALRLWGDRPIATLVPLAWQARAPKGQEAPPLPPGPDLEPAAWRVIRVDDGPTPQWILGRPPELPKAHP